MMSGACCAISETVLPNDISEACHSRNLVKRKKISSIGSSSTARSIPCGASPRTWSYALIARVSGRFMGPEEGFYHASMASSSANAQHPSSRRLVEVVSQPRHRSRSRSVDRCRPRACRAGGESERQAGRRVASHRIRRRPRDCHGARCRGRRDPAPLHRAPLGARREGALSGSPGHHRPGDRKRVLLRLLLQAAFYARRPFSDRKKNGRDRETGSPGAEKGNEARGGG